MRFILLSLLVAVVHGHGYFKSPVARHAVHMHPELNPPDGPTYWDYQAVWCGNNPQDLAISDCGRCGDIKGETNFQRGGLYDKNVIGGNYTSGSTVDFVTNYQAAHYGVAQFEICQSETESDNCWTVLPIVGGSEQVRIDNRICVPHDNGYRGDITARVQLPAGFRCNRCSVRFTYRTAYPGYADWNVCGIDPRPAQTFRNCADIRIQ